VSVFYDVVPEERGRAAQSAPALELIGGILPRMSNSQFWTFLGAVAIAGIGVLTLVQLQLSQGSFVESSLESEIRLTNTRVHDLQTKMIQLTSGKSMREKAKKLGMVEASNPVGLKLVDGAVLGLPKPAPASDHRAIPGTNVDTSTGAWRTNDAAVQVTGG
jgi:hypothetical protein